MELIQTGEDIVQEYLSECNLTPIFEKQRHLFEQWHYDSNTYGHIFCIEGVQWVALTPEKYFDDDKHYKVTSHQTCIDELEEMIADKPTDDDSSTWKPLLFITEDTGSLGIAVEAHKKKQRNSYHWCYSIFYSFQISFESGRYFV